MTMLAVAVCCGFTACGDDDDEPDNGGSVIKPGSDLMTAIPTVGNTPDALLGKWVYSAVDEDGEEASISFQFKHRGICAVNFDDEYNVIGSCNTTGNNLTVNIGNMVFFGTYSISGDKLVYHATMDDLDPYEPYTAEMTFSKVSSETGYEPAPVDGPLVGVWYDKKRTHRFTFLSNGLGQYYQEGRDYDTIPAFFAYSVNDTEIKYYSADGEDNYLFGFSTPYSIDGDVLSITGINGDGYNETIVFTK